MSLPDVLNLWGTVQMIFCRFKHAGGAIPGLPGLRFQQWRCMGGTRCNANSGDWKLLGHNGTEQASWCSFCVEGRQAGRVLEVQRRTSPWAKNVEQDCTGINCACLNSYVGIYHSFLHQPGLRRVCRQISSGHNCFDLLHRLSNLVQNSMRTKHALRVQINTKQDYEGE